MHNNSKPIMQASADEYFFILKRQVKYLFMHVFI